MTMHSYNTYNKLLAIQDPDQASQYTQHEVNLLKEQADSNPQGIQ